MSDLYKFDESGKRWVAAIDEFKGLSMRSLRVLDALGLTSCEDVRTAADRGELIPSRGTRRKATYYGMKTYKEILRHVGINIKDEEKHRCAKCGQIIRAKK